MKFLRIALFVASFILCLIWAYPCLYADDTSDWPQYVRLTMWIAPGAENVRCYMLGESYQVSYSVKVHYPAMDLIDSMANSMISKGWERLIYDPLNPGDELSFVAEAEKSEVMKHFGWPHSRKDFSEAWKCEETKYFDWPHRWMDFWQDKSGNVVHYRYDYDCDTEELKKMRPRGVACTLKALTIFYRADLWKLLPRGRRRAQKNWASSNYSETNR